MDSKYVRTLAAAIGVSLVAGSFALGFVMTRAARPRSLALPVSIPVYDEKSVPSTLRFAEQEAPFVVLVLDVWCKVCGPNAASWRALIRPLREHTAQVVMLSYSGSAETQEFQAKYQLTDVPVLYIDRAAVEAMGIRAVPATILVAGTGGNSAEVWEGLLLESDVVAMLKKLDRVGNPAGVE